MAENLENHRPSSKAKEDAPLVGNMLVSEQFTSVFRKPNGLVEQLSVLPSALDLLKQISDEPHKQAHGGSAEKAKASHNQKVEKGGEGSLASIGEVLAKVTQEWIDKSEARQRKIADKEAKDPNVQKVSEKHDGPIATVIVERRDGSVTTYMPDGRKVTEKDGLKVTEFTPDYNDTQGRTKVTEYPNGAVETEYKNGSTLFQPKRGDGLKTDKDGTQTVIKPDGTQIISKPGDPTRTIIKPDHTKITRKGDGTEIVESPNHDRVITKPEQVKPDGTKVWHKDDGTEVSEKPDGTQVAKYPESVNEKVQAVIKKPNGDISTVMRDFTAVTIKKDGTVVNWSNDGTAIALHPNGTVETKAADGTKTMKDLDGTVYTKHPNGSSEIKFPDGSSLVKDKDGDVQQKLNYVPKGMFDYLNPTVQQAESVAGMAALAVKEASGFSF